jgi:hypothetical protein
MPPRAKKTDPVFVTDTDLARAHSLAKRPSLLPKPIDASVPRKLAGFLSNPERKTRIPRRRSDNPPPDQPEALLSMIQKHEHSLAEIEGCKLTFESIDEDEAISAARAKISDITRQAQELKDRRRKELFDLQMIAAEKYQKTRTRHLSAD